ncbi:MAG TPA: type II toxin-antitoxin system VapC family toxin [Candidatus Acidoferrales bacterium]|nr:type II toxin-antitoxin system VapC family toxin [Candidatus Acidoferrales bacterium]
MTVLIDSWAWIEYWKGGKHASSAATHIEGDEEAVVASINLTELYLWVSRYYDEATAKKYTEAVERRCYVIPLDKEIALSAAKLKLRHKMGIADSVVLATARHANGKVVTGDPDFKDIDGVIFIGQQT